MKTRKVLLVGLFLGLSLALTGCNEKNKTLTCTMSQSGVDVEMVVDFKGDTVNDIKFSYDMNLSSYSDTQIEAIGEQDFCSRVKLAMSTLKDAFGNCKQEIKSKHLRVSASLDPDKLKDAGFSKDSSPKEAKESLEKQGYTCK